jgi:hypothetical protein
MLQIKQLEEIKQSKNEWQSRWLYGPDFLKLSKENWRRLYYMEFQDNPEVTLSIHERPQILPNPDRFPS